jgi:hypothetical protein
MKRYEPGTHRVAFGIAAAAMTAITFSIFVVLPAETGSEAHETLVVAMAHGGPSSTCGSAVACSPAHTIPHPLR